MRKNQPGSPPPVPDTPTKRDDVITQVREYALITPLFGGGVSTGETDPVTPIRGTEIRGHLRFWWRACRAWRFDGPEKMKDEEDKLWGAAAHKDEDAIPFEKTIQLKVDIVNKGRQKPYTDPEIPGYAAFPMQPAPKPLLDGIAFNLTITFPEDHREEVEAALWAWETFGGIGARTRRGFGALHLRAVDMEPIDLLDAREVKSWINKKLSRYIQPGAFPPGVSHLSQHPQCHVIELPHASPADIWKHLIKALQDFRQAKKRSDKGRGQRSQWPESKAILEITQGKGNQNQQAYPVPRAAFGLPIVFQFPGKENVTLQGNNVERLASPLILRPFLCANKQAVGLALLLEGSRPIPGKLELKDITKPHQLEEKLTPAQAGKIDKLDGEPDVLKAFMKSLDTGGNTR